MTNECVVGVFDSMTAAETAVHILDRAGFAPDHVSIVARHVDPASNVGQELTQGDDSMRDAVVGATLGGLVGIVSDVALFVITGIGVIVMAGPLLAATGAVVGAFLGTMEGWGVHHRHIHDYETLVREGKVLVVVDGQPKEVAEAERMLRQTDAARVHLHAQSGDDATEIDDRP